MDQETMMRDDDSRGSARADDQQPTEHTTLALRAPSGGRGTVPWREARLAMQVRPATALTGSPENDVRPCVGDWSAEFGALALWTVAAMLDDTSERCCATTIAIACSYTNPEAIDDELPRAWWRAADDLLGLGRRLPTGSNAATRRQLVAELATEPVYRIVASHLCAIRMCIGDRVEGIRSELSAIYTRQIDNRPLGQFTRVHRLQRAAFAVAARAREGDAPATAALVTWREWIADPALAGRYDFVDMLWERSEGLARPTEYRGAWAIDVSAEGREPAPGPAPAGDAPASGFDSPWAAFGFSAGVPHTGPSAVFARYLERSRALGEELLSNDAGRRAAAYRGREALDRALEVLGGIRFKADYGRRFHVPAMYTTTGSEPGIGWLIEPAQRISSMLDYFERAYGAEASLVLESHSADGREHDLWIRPGRVTDPFGLYRVSLDGTVTDYATATYHPSDDASRRPPDRIIGCLVAGGGVAPDTRHFTTWLAERFWGRGFTAAVTRIGAGDTAPTVSAMCPRCGRRIEVTFAMRFCLYCMADVPSQAYAPLARTALALDRAVEHSADASIPRRWESPDLTLIRQVNAWEAQDRANARSGSGDERWVP